MQPIQLVIFDMAGTTIDEDNLVYKTLKFAIERGGYPVSLETVLLLGAGKEKLQAIRDVLAEVTGTIQEESTIQAIFEDFKGLLAGAYHRYPAQSMPGALAIFQRLKEKGIKVVLNTGYSREIADTLLSQLGWSENPFIDLCITANDVHQGRPHPDMIHLAMKKLDIAVAAAVAKIGDSIVDIEEGLNAGCGLVAGITTGAQTAEQLESAHPHIIVNSLEGFWQHLQRYCSDAAILEKQA